ncbi:hypothetical protein PENTCL1PPCAC_27884, partial [Pristionchus entomophagus]
HCSRLDSLSVNKKTLSESIVLSLTALLITFDDELRDRHFVFVLPSSRHSPVSSPHLRRSNDEVAEIYAIQSPAH